jgi:PAS domain S-box-containing protein
MLQPPSSSLLQPAEDSRLFLWTGEFRDRRVEQMYRQQRLQPVRTLLQACGLAASAVFFLLIIRQYMLFGFSLTFWLDAAVRIIGLVIGLIFQILVRRAATITMLDIVGGVGMASLTTLTFMTWLIGSPPALNAGTLSFGYLLVFFLLVPCPAQAVLANAIYLTVGTGFLSVLWLPNSSSIFNVVLFLCIGNGLGLIGMRQFKLERRRNFLSREEARRVTEALTLARQEGRRRNEYQAWALDALQVGVILLHPGGEIHSLNRRATELLALPPGALQPGDTHETLMRFLLQRRDFGDMELSDVQYHIDRLLRGLGTIAAIRHASTGKILEFTLNRLPDQSVAVTIFDATERYALNRRLRHAVEVAGDGFAIYDSLDRIAICSSRFAALYGLTAEQAIGKSFEDLLALGYDRGVFSRNEQEAGSTAGTVTTSRRHIPERMIEIRTSAGEWFLVHERVTPSGDLVVVRTNITARRRMEDELRRAKEEAERALADLRGAQANLILAEKMASLGSLVAGMSHEISTPLGIGVSAASHLSEEVEQLTTRFRDGQLKRSDLEDFLETATEATRIMQGNLTRAASLIQAFKQVSVDQTTDEVREFGLGEYLHEIMLSLAPALRRTPHRVDIDCPPNLMIRNRPGALGQIVTNLLMNTLQHAYEGGAEPGLINISVTVPRDGRVVMEFRDNGKGIAAENLPRIFDPFFTTKRGTGGTGLGLHIVYNLVSQVLGGTIAVSSRPGEGTRFTISFPQTATS